MSNVMRVTLAPRSLITCPFEFSHPRIASIQSLGFPEHFAQCIWVERNHVEKILLSKETRITKKREQD